MFLYRLCPLELLLVEFSAKRIEEYRGRKWK